MENLAIIYRASSDLQENPRNTRLHGTRQLDKLAKAIQRFGFTNPILIDADRMVMCGHGRLQAAKKLGLQSIPTMQVDHMTPAQSGRS